MPDEPSVAGSEMPPAVALAREDLRVVSAVISARFADPSGEQQRIVVVENLLRVTNTLGRALAEHARHGLSESRGSHSRWDVAEDAEQVYALLVEYGTLVRRIGREYELPPTPDA